MTNPRNLDWSKFVSPHMPPPGVVATSRIDGHLIHFSRLSAEDGGGIFAEVTDMPGCASDGETLEEAARNVKDAMRSWQAMAERMSAKGDTQ